MKHTILIIMLLLGVFKSLNAQTTQVELNIMDQFHTPLIGMWVVYGETRAQTDLDGKVSLPITNWPAHLDLITDSGEEIHVEVKSHEEASMVMVDMSKVLDEFVVKEKADQELSTLKTRNVETIGKREFTKAACCRLSESFDNSGAVSVSETDAVTGAKEMEVLGLRGIYSLITFNNTPDFTGIVYPYSLDMIPGTWLDQVAISKGSSNAMNGSNGIAGQVNINTKTPFEDDPLFVNLYGSTLGRYEGNVHLNKILKNPAFATGVYLHGSKNFNEIDRNADGFMDMPLSQQLNGLARINMNGIGAWESGLSLHMVNDQRESGQFNTSDASAYKATSDANRISINGNTGYAGFEKEGRSIGFKYQYTVNSLDAAFGKSIQYDGNQNRAYVQALYEDRFREGDHIIYAGASYLNDKLDQTISNQAFDRHESVPGVYAEYTYNPEITNADKRFLRRLGLIFSGRVDFNNVYGTQFAPAFAAKYNFTEDQLVRVNVGKGFRSPYFFTDNISSYTNGLPFEVREELRAEEAVNYGLSYTIKTKLGGNNLGLNVDLYQTQFQNQIIVDQETDASKVIIYNLDGPSQTTSGLVSANYTPIEGFDVKLAYKYTQIEFTQLSGLVDKSMTPRHRMLMALFYTTKDKRWEFSNSTHWFGKQEFMKRIAIQDGVDMTREEAKAYLHLNAQVTRKWNNFDIYLGGENLTNVTQDVIVQNWSDPNSLLFDVSQVYRPTIGIRGYVGMRWTIY